MSRANGLCQTVHGDLYYFVYDGTSDMCYTRLYYSSKLYDETTWLFDDNTAECNCSDKDETPCILSTDYGKMRFLFQSMACEKCLCITGRIFLDEEQ